MNLEENFLSYEDIIKKVECNKDINYLAFPIVKHHVNGTKASLYYLKSKNINVNGYVFIGKHPITGVHIGLDEFEEFSNITVTYGIAEFKKPSSLVEKIQYNFFINKRNGNNRIIYIVTTQPQYNLAWKLNKIGIDCIFIIIDDGAGSYINPYSDALCYCKIYNNNGFCLKKIIKYVLTYIKTFINLRKKEILIKEGTQIDLRIFRLGKTGLVKNSDISKFYIKSYENNASRQGIELFKHSVLINTQCFKECNMIFDGADVELYRRVFDVIKKYNSKIVVKPHPREIDTVKYEKYNISLYDNKTVTQEEILAEILETNRPKCIISITSSCLLNATGIFGVPAISLAKIMIKENVNRLMRDHLQDYIDSYQGIIQFPENMMAFEELICRYCK